jgi:hypothetical protein
MEKTCTYAGLIRIVDPRHCVRYGPTPYLNLHSYLLTLVNRGQRLCSSLRGFRVRSVGLVSLVET